MKISAVIITLNEERNIGRCIDSLLNVADEILVIDSFSADRTLDICREKGVVFLQQSWLGYAAQKNWGNEKAAYNWILSIDADEVLSEMLCTEILALKGQATLTTTAFAINRLTNYCGSWIRHCGWYPDTKIRLFNREKARWNSAEIHEDIEFLSAANIHTFKGDLLHYSYHTLSDHLQQVDNFTSLTAQTAFLKGKKITTAGMIFRSWWKFIRDYIFKLGFLDGYAGFLVCKISAFATFMKYAKLKQLIKNSKK